MSAKFFGARVKRLEDPALLLGRGRFVDDLKLRGRVARLLRPFAARPR
jgi:aerobic carbon-monoxide dehydrogenase large subunit